MKKLLIVIILLPTFLFSQHSIHGTFMPAENFTYAFLYQSTPLSLNYLDRSKVEANGQFSIALDSMAKPGMYKIVYGLPQLENNFDFIYDGKEDISLTFSLSDGLVFTESNENKLWSSYTKSMELVNMTISNYYAQESTDKNAFSEIFKTLSDTQQAFEDAAKGTMALVFIKANRPYIPTNYEDLNTYSSNFKENYLKNVDFSHPLLQSSDFLTDRVMAYVFGMSATNDDATYKKHIDDVFHTIGKDHKEIKSLLLENIWHKMVEIEDPEIANYISDTYLLQLAKDTNNTELQKTLTTYQNIASESIAQDFEISYEAGGKTVNTTLHQLNSSENYLLIFWSSTCGHCLNELPKVKDFIDQYPSNLKVIAFAIEDGKDPWERTIKQFPDFIHVLGLGHWQNPIAKAYGITSTPSYFILDKDKHIKNKPATFEELQIELEAIK